MLTLNSAAANAFAAREIKLEPILTVFDDTGEPVTVPPSSIIERPRRRLSPFLDKSPVMRLDLDLIPSPAIRALFQEEREIEYREIFNGQILERFKGRIKVIKKGWTIQNGAVQDSVKVSCMSPSQVLSDYHDEAVFTDLSGSVTGNWLAHAFYRKQPNDAVYLVKGVGSTSKDPLPEWLNMVIDPHGNGSGIGTEEKATIEWFESTAGPSTAVHGTGFNLIVEGDKLKVQWLGGACPPDGLEYALKCKVVKGFVIPKTKTTFTPSLGVYTPMPSTDMGSIDHIEQIPSSFVDYEKGWNSRFCYPQVHYQLDVAGMQQQQNGDWQFLPDRGILYYLGTKGKIVKTHNSGTEDITAIGLSGCYYLDPAHLSNEVTTYIAALYGRAGLTAGSLDVSGIAISHGLLRAPGDAMLKAYTDNLPPNYLIMDGPDGRVTGKMVSQKPVADFKLRTLTALQTEEPPEKATFCRVWGSEEVTERIAPYWGGVAFPSGWDYPHRIRDGIAETYATVDPSKDRAYIEIPNTWEKRIIQIRLKFQGRITLHLRSDEGFPTYGRDGGPSGNSTAYFHATPQELVITDFDQFPVRWDTWDQEFRQVYIDLHRLYGSPEARMYSCEVTYEKRSVGRACFTNSTSVTEGVWNSTVDGEGSIRTKRIDPTIVKRWMVIPKEADTEGSNYSNHWWNHRVKDIEDPGFASILGDTLRVYAADYLDDILRQAAAQQATVIIEPALEIGDTVAVEDVSTGSEYNRLVVGYEDGGTWNQPATTLYLSDFS